MHDPSAEIVAAREFRRVARFVFVISRAHEQEIAGEAHDFRSALAVATALGLNGPARLVRGPRRPLDAVVEVNFLIDSVFGGGLAHIVQDPRPVGDRLWLGPWLERITQREHVAVGADAGIPEQVPGAANAVAALQERKALARTFLLQVISRADPGEPGADDQYVDML